MLTDTGPLVALIHTQDAHHARCWQVVDALPPGGMLTPDACVTEAMHLLFRAGGYPLQARLWQVWRTGLLRVHSTGEAEYARRAALMETFRDAPMDYADAALVAAAEVLGQRRVFTLDRHFYAYRTADGGAFEVIP